MVAIFLSSDCCTSWKYALLKQGWYVSVGGRQAAITSQASKETREIVTIMVADKNNSYKKIRQVASGLQQAPRIHFFSLPFSLIPWPISAVFCVKVTRIHFLLRNILVG